MKGILLADKSNQHFNQKIFCTIFSDYNMEKLAEIIDIKPVIYDRKKLDEAGDAIRDTDFIFSSWGFEYLNEEEIQRYFPRLQAVFYAAGSVKHFVVPFFNCGIRVFSAGSANALPAAEFTLAQILLASKGVPGSTRRMKSGTFQEARTYAECFTGNYHSRVGILGAGKVGTRLIQLLRPFCIDVLVYDPFLSEERARELAVQKASLEMIFGTCDVISNHLAYNEQTHHLISEEYLCMMKDYTTFINTAWNEHVDMPALYRLFQKNPTLTAILDLDDLEILKTCPLNSLENVYLTPRIAGSISGEVARMGEFMTEECRAFLNGEPLQHEVTPEMLQTLA